jgi:hypothetical protein
MRQCGWLWARWSPTPAAVDTQSFARRQRIEPRLQKAHQRARQAQRILKSS